MNRILIRLVCVILCLAVSLTLITWLPQLFLIKCMVILSATFCTAFVVIYHFRWKWWKSAIGRHMMIFMAGFDLVLLLTVVSIFFPRLLQNKPYIGLGCWILIAFLFGWRLLVLVAVRKTS